VGVAWGGRGLDRAHPQALTRAVEHDLDVVAVRVVDVGRVVALVIVRA